MLDIIHIWTLQNIVFYFIILFKQLYGGFDKIDDWSDGLLAKTIRTANQLNTQNDNSLYRKNSDEVQYWFVFDGPLEPGLLEPLESLLDSKNELLLANGERLKPSGEYSD